MSTPIGEGWYRFEGKCEECDALFEMTTFFVNDKIKQESLSMQVRHLENGDHMPLVFIQK